MREGLLVAVDGPDGSGKSTLTKMIAEKKEAIIIKPTYFSSSSGARQIGEEFEKNKDYLRASSREHNNYFLRAMRRNYQETIFPLLKENNFIILDSSEIRALSFIMDRGEKGAIEETRGWISTNLINCGIIPDLRVNFIGDPEDLMKNLFSKEVLDSGDPRDKEEMKKRLSCYRRAIKEVQAIQEEVPRIEIEVKHAGEEKEKYLEKLSERILGEINSKLLLV